jgi:phenylpropionate dioxygenase-like ring-hydroxylating dioxygenase large terminal subunit
MDVSALVTPTGVSRRIYVDEAIYRAELEKIWGTTWVYVAHESEIAQTGDYKTTQLGETPVIVTRDEDGAVAVLVNRCMHRGATVCQSRRGNSNFFRCQYHGWTYDNAGALTGVPHPQGWSDLDQKALGLVRVPRVDSYRGFVFASFAPHGEALRDHLAAAAEYIDLFVDLSPEGAIEARRGEHKYVYEANWKFQLENSVDGYHTGFVHRSYFDIQQHHSGKKQFYGNDTSAGKVKDLGKGHAVIDSRAAVGDAYVHRVLTSPGGPELVAELRARYGEERMQVLASAVAGAGFNLAIFPNLILLGAQIRVIKPAGVGRTLVDVLPTTMVGVPERMNQLRLRTHEAFFGPAGFGAPDDLEMFQRVQQGLAAEQIDPLLLTRGLGREVHLDGDVIVSERSDETTQRAQYRHWARLMSASNVGAVAVPA